MSLSQDILTKMMELPNRGSGTVYEQKAGEYIKSVYNYLKIPYKEVDSKTIKNSLNNHLILSFSLILLTILVNFLNIIFITLPVFIFTVLVYIRAFKLPFNLPLKFFKNATVSKNIYVDIPAKDQELNTIVITSHYDTGNDYGPLVNILGPIYNFIRSSQNDSTSSLKVPEYINNPLVISNLSLLLTLLALFLPDNSAKFFFGLLAGTPLAIGIYLLAKSNNKYSPGALDNGVGTSLVVELASIISQNPLPNTRVIFANIAAEETLTRGTLPLLNSLNLNKLKTFIIDLDCIGEDEIMLINSEPSYPLGLPIAYDSTFDVLSDFANEYLQGEFKMGDSPLFTDNQELLLNQYRVTGLITTMPKNGYPTNYHNNKDTIEKIKWDKVEAVRNFVIEYLEFFDSISKEVVF